MRLADFVAPDNFHPDVTNTAEDFEKCQFLDLRMPLLMQIWESNWRYDLLHRHYCCNIPTLFVANRSTFAKYISPDMLFNQPDYSVPSTSRSFPSLPSRRRNRS